MCELIFSKINCAVSFRYFKATGVFYIMASSSKRKILTVEQRVDVLKGLDTGQSCRAVVLACGCGKYQTTRIRLERDAIMKEWQSGG